MSELAAMVEALPDVTAVAKHTWVFDAGDGRNVRIVLRGGRIEFFGVLDPTRRSDEEHGGWYDDEQANDALHEAIEALAVPIQARTRWALDHVKLGYADEPHESCPECDADCFEWEAQCAACGCDLGRTITAPPDEDDRIARAIVDELLRRGHIELRAGGRRAVEVGIAAALGNFGGSISWLSRCLLDDAAVIELYCDEDELASVVTSVKAAVTTS
jgi:hypothetical protein